MDTQRFIRLYQGIAVSVVALIFCIIAVFGGVIPSMKNRRTRLDRAVDESRQRRTGEKIPYWKATMRRNFVINWASCTRQYRETKIFRGFWHGRVGRR